MSFVETQHAQFMQSSCALRSLIRQIPFIISHTFKRKPSKAARDSQIIKKSLELALSADFTGNCFKLIRRGLITWHSFYRFFDHQKKSVYRSSPDNFFSYQHHECQHKEKWRDSANRSFNRKLPSSVPLILRLCQTFVRIQIPSDCAICMTSRTLDKQKIFPPLTSRVQP